MHHANFANASILAGSNRGRYARFARGAQLVHGAGSPVGRHAFLAVLAIVIAVATTSAGTDRVATEDAPILHVGPTRELKTPSAAAKVALDGTIVEIDAGEYVDDVAVWTQNGLTLRGVGGMAHLRSETRDQSRQCRRKHERNCKHRNYRRL